MSINGVALGQGRPGMGKAYAGHRKRRGASPTKIIGQRARRQNARLLEILTPDNGKEAPAFHQGIALFDFSGIDKGLQGYYWNFPSVVQGQRVMNRGIFDSRIHPGLPKVPLKPLFQQTLLERGCQLDDYPLQGFPIHGFDLQETFSLPRILLAGDAAGVDPLLGEGVSFALAYGDAASNSIIEAFHRQDFRFQEYSRQILSHPILQQLRARAKIARWVYTFSHSPRLLPWIWKLTPLFFRGLTWYRPQYVPVNHPRIFRIDVD